MNTYQMLMKLFIHITTITIITCPSTVYLSKLDDFRLCMTFQYKP